MIPTKPTSRPSRRQGFTLIELLIVIAVIAVLAALILPAIGNTKKTVQIAGVRSEINQLEAAIAKFQADHGVEPPSSIVICEAAADWNLATSASSRAIIQSIWPQFNFAKDRDLNRNGTIDSPPVTLSPSECLVLFLGGMYTNSGTATSPLFAMIGFSKDPTDPLAPAVAGATREAPLFEFQTGRLTDVNGNGVPEYKDSLPTQKMPYLYYSSYATQGYNETSTFEFAPSSKFVLATPYWQGADVTSARWKTSSHQIISPGFDGLYGSGGPYVTTGSTHFPTAKTTPPNGTLPSGAALPTDAQRIPEADNITNFSNGVLQP